jgi:glutathione S-transferase
MFFAAVTNNALGFVMPEGRKRMAGYGSFADVINVLDGAVSRDDYVVGDSFTAADVYLGSQVGWGLMFGSIEKRPAGVQCTGFVALTAMTCSST